MDQLKPPWNLDFESPDLAYAWKKWREDLATKTDEKERKVKFFLYLIGSKGREIYGTMQFEKEEKDRTLDELIQLFGEYCDPKRMRRWRGTSSSQETRNQEKHLISTLQNWDFLKKPVSLEHYQIPYWGIELFVDYPALLWERDYSGSLIST